MEGLTVEMVAQLIGAPPEEWEGQCTWVVSELIKTGKVIGKKRYGHYYGPISPKSIFARSHLTTPCRHGWIELEDGRVLDPTRWVFEAIGPYIYIGPNRCEYDAGGQILKMSNLAPPPDYLEGEETVEAPQEFIEAFLVVPGVKEGREVFTLDQVFWLANLPVPNLGEIGRPLYKWLNEHGYKVFIPLDNWQLVMED